MATVEKLVTDYLDLWTAAIKRKSAAGRGSSSKLELYGTKKLRELILELAVRGLLVPQDPNDEPASELLKKIAAEKVKLVKADKIKKEKPLPLIGDDEKSFDLPNGWSWSRLQNISEYIQRGKGPVYADSGRVRVISQKCVQWRGFDISASRFVDDSSLSGYKEERFLKNNDLLWNSTGTGTVGRVNVFEQLVDQTIVADSHVTVVRTLNVHSKYFCAYLSSPGIQSRIEPTHDNSLVSGSTQQVELNTSAVVLLPVPVPPLDEQLRIVAKVDELMALCDQLEAQTDASLSAYQTLVETLLNALTNAADHVQFASAWQRIAEHFDTLFTTEESIDKLKQTILQLAVMGKLVPQDPNDEPASELLKKIAAEKAKLVKDGLIRNVKQLSPIAAEEKPFELPSGWVFCRLQELVSVLGDGLHGTPSYNDNGDYYFINGNNLNDGTILIKPDTKRVGLTEFEKHRKELNIRTVLVSINGTIGNVAFYNNEPVILGKSACYFNLLSGIEKLFIKRFIESPLFFRYAASEATGSTISNLGLKAMNAFPIPLPPTDEQQRIIAKVDELFTLCDRIKIRLNEAQTTQLHLAEAMTEKVLARA